MRRDQAGSYGAEVASWAGDYLQTSLMPWQQYAIDAQLAHDADGRLLHRSALVSVARQNGKTVALSALVGWWLTERPKVAGPQTVLTTAHSLDLASALFRRLAPILEEKFRATIRWSYGREVATLPDGSQWLVKAATPSAGHGWSVDLIVADEVWNISSDALDQGLIPTQRARPEPLLSMWSTAGTEQSHALMRWRDQGIRAIGAEQPSMVFLEWSPPPELDQESPEAWAYANPALGHTLTPDQHALELASPNRQGFLRGSLNVWVSTVNAWLPAGEWDQRARDLEPLRGGFIAIESRIDESYYFAVRAAHGDDGIIRVQLEREHRTLDALWEWVGEELRSDPAVTFLIAATVAATMPLEYQPRAKLVGRRELAAMTQTVGALIAQGRVQHDGAGELAEHVNRAVAAETGGGYTLVASKSPGPIELARCMVWAAGTAARPARRAARPTVARSRPGR